MVSSRRHALRLLAGAAILPSQPARAQRYPAHPGRIIAGFPPGGVSDAYARLIALWLSRRLAEQFIVENRPGAGGNLAAEEVAKAQPDGYTLLLTTSADAWNKTLYNNLNFDLLRDFAPVAAISRGPGVLVVNPSLPVDSVAALIAYAKRNPGKVTVASAGIGSAPHMYWELFRSMTGVNMVHVPYRGGGPAIADLIGGQVQAYFGTTAAAIGSITAGKLRPLGVTAAKRLPALPAVPAIAETVPGYEATIYVGIAAPHNTPGTIVATLSQAMIAADADPQIAARIAQFGDTLLPLAADAFAKLVAAETAKWAAVIKRAGIRAE